MSGKQAVHNALPQALISFLFQRFLQRGDRACILVASASATANPRPALCSGSSVSIEINPGTLSGKIDLSETLDELHRPFEESLAHGICQPGQQGKQGLLAELLVLDEKQTRRGGPTVMSLLSTSRAMIGIHFS